MDNNNAMKQYRNIPFKYVEWTTWNGKTSTGYHCEDKSLLEGVDKVKKVYTGYRFHSMDDYFYKRILIHCPQKRYEYIKAWVSRNIVDKLYQKIIKTINNYDV